jgi:hypothetical protein
MECRTEYRKHKCDAIFPCNTKKRELDPWKHKKIMNYTQDQHKTQIIHTWCGLYRFGTKFFKKLLQNMKNTYVHSTKVSNNCHKTDHISGQTKTKEFNIFIDDQPKMAIIGDYWSDKQTMEIVDLLKEYQDVFACYYNNLKGLVQEMDEMKIDLIPGAKPIKK